MLTGIAIVLGVAMISGTYILTDTVERAFTNLLVDSYAGTDAVVTGKGLDISIDGEKPPPPPVDESLLGTVRGVDEVALATGSVLDEQNTKILTPEGKAVNSEGWPTLGFGVDTDPAVQRFNPLKLFEGTWPAAENEVVIDAGTADEQGYEVGDTVEISTLQPKRSFEVVGVAQVRRGRQPRRDQLRRLHGAGGAGAPRPGGSVRRDFRRREGGDLRGRARLRDRARHPGRHRGRQRDVPRPKNRRTT